MHTENGDLVVAFTVEWQDRDQGIFQVRVKPSRMLPACDSPAVRKILADYLETHIDGAKPNSIDGHREPRFDPQANQRRGACVVHTDDGDFPLEYVVDWQDLDRGVFQVRLVE